MKIIYCLLCFILTSFVAMGQVQLERQVITFGGNLSHSNQTQLSATLGETIVTTAIEGSFTLTQGFQQTDVNMSVGIRPSIQIKIDYSVFPNPTSDVLNIRIEAEKPVLLLARLMTLEGRQMHEEYLRDDAIQIHQWSVRDYPAGHYLIAMYDQTGSIRASHKIQIVH